MGTAIPEGSAAPEQPKDTDATEAKPVEQKNKTKTLLVAGGLGVLVLTAVLIGVLPDWGDSSSSSSSSKNVSSPLNPVEEEPISDAQALFFESSKGPFDVKIPLFSPGITDGYASKEDLEHDLEQLAKFLLNDAISSNTEAGRRPSDGDAMFDTPVADSEGPEAIMEDGGMAVDEQSGNLADATDFTTNNQEFNVDRADFVKSDGNLVFAAYGDYLLVWTVDGQGIIAQIQMPPLNFTDYHDIGFPMHEAEPMPEREPDPVDDGESLPQEEETAAEAEIDIEPATAARSSIGWWNPKPNIEALLVDGNRLTLIVSGYGMEHTNAMDTSPVLYDYLSTNIRIYDIDDGDLQLVSDTHVNGSFRNAYSVGQNAYVVTQSSINTWDHLTMPIQRWQPEFAGLSDEEYLEKAIEFVDDGLVRSFVDRLLDQLEVNGEVNLGRFSVFVDSLASDNADESLVTGSIPNAITQLISFDMSVGSVESAADLALDISATFRPASWGHVYATDGMIIVADQGWSWTEQEGRSAQKTFLTGFRLNGPSSSHSLIGTVDGYILNQFAIDFVEESGASYVRIATTQSFWTPWAMPFEEDMMINGDSEPSDSVESSTLNQIIVLRIPDSDNEDGDKVLEQVGSVELGEPNERFTSVRFFDKFAYAVTFERIDPFYVVDLSTEQPEVLGELKVPGFSEYLHPIDSDDRYLVAVGQEADDGGSIIGLQLSLFDATDPANPSLVDRLVVLNENNSWSSSAVSWDERAFRFLKLGEKTGKLIIPVSIHSWQKFDEVTGEKLEQPEDRSFEGFSVFNVEFGKITKDFDIDHSFTIDYTEDCHYSYGWLPERSFVFNGDVMTMKGHTAISTNLTSGANEWTLPINELGLGCNV